MNYDLDDFLAKNRRRKLGRTGRRQLVLRVMANGQMQEDLMLNQVWTATDMGIDSIVVVESGSALSGTQVCLSEKFGEIELGVKINIRGSLRSFSVGSPYDTFVFGSEFTYEDFRFFLPPGRHGTNGDEQCLWVATYPSMHSRHFLDASFAIPVSTEWIGGGEKRPFRIVSSAQFREISGVIMPSIMTARRIDTATGEQSCLLLGDVTVES